jgi:uncharacterized protein YhaN
MGIQIERIGIKSIGPLQAMEFTLRRINLFYGHNEVGKTFLVEFLYRSLFKNQQLLLRKSDNASGLVALSGLEEGETQFGPGSRKKLEDLLPGAETSLPRDFSRLLVVKGGELDLSTEDGGVNETILKQFLSIEGLLDSISSRIKSADYTATYTEGVITGNHQGLIKNYKKAESDLKDLDDLLREVEGHLATGELLEMKRQLEELNARQQVQDDAKRHQAYLLNIRRQQLQAALAKLPEDDLGSIGQMLTQLEVKRRDLLQTKAELERNVQQSAHYAWLKNAVSVYSNLINHAQASKNYPMTVWLVVAGIALVLAVLAGTLDSPGKIIISAFCALLAGIFVYIYIWGSGRVSPDETRQTQLAAIEADFRQKFNAQGKINQVTLAEKLDTVEGPHFASQNNRESVRNLEQQLSTLEVEIQAAIKPLSGTKVEVPDFEPVYIQLKEKRSSLTQEFNLVDKELASLSINESEYRVEPAAESYDAAAWFDISQQQEAAREKLDVMEDNQADLKSKVAGRVGLLSTSNWEELLTELDAQRKEKSAEYRQLKAEIIGKIAVIRVLMELKEEESARIEAGLQDENIGRALLSTTGHYQRIRREDGKLLVSDNQSEYTLNMLSTGAHEQVLLGLRLGFASRVLQGQPLFLILDDAFQHSDWNRRENLVKQMFSLADSGWQILYFSMDDNIRDLYQKYGNGRKDYQMIPLDPAK